MRFLQHLFLVLYILTKLSCAQKLIMLFLDGFRWDYIKNTQLKGFRQLMTEGAYINRVTPVFPADCHPNIYSMFTGLYPQHHGVISNKVYSKQRRKEFDHSDFIHRRDIHNWVNAEPLWITAKKQGKVTFTYHFPICESSFGKLSPSYCIPYHQSDMSVKQLNLTVAAALRTLHNGVSDFTIVYNDEMDRLTHSYGPQSSQLFVDLLPSIDEIIQIMIKSIMNTDISLVLVSDHGMAQIARNREIDLERMILRSDIERVINQGGFVAIWPLEGDFNEVHLRLLIACQDPNSHLTLYTHDSLPPHWNVYNQHLTPPLLLVADPGYFISSEELSFPLGSDFYDSGWHGYAPETEAMASPLLAYGSRVLPGSYLESSHVTDTYQLLAILCGVEPNPHNGSVHLLPSLLIEHHYQWQDLVHAQHMSTDNSSHQSSSSVASCMLSKHCSRCVVLILTVVLLATIITSL